MAKPRESKKIKDLKKELENLYALQRKSWQEQAFAETSVIRWAKSWVNFCPGSTSNKTKPNKEYLYNTRLVNAVTRLEKLPKDRKLIQKKIDKITKLLYLMTVDSLPKNLETGSKHEQRSKSSK